MTGFVKSCSGLLSLVYLGGVICTLSSCGGKPDIKGPSAPPVTGKITYNKVEFYQPEDPKCGPNSAVDFLSSETKIWIAGADGTVSQHTYDLSDYKGIGLEGKGVRQVWAQHYEIIDDSGNSYISPEKEAPLYICRPDGNYRRDSLENKALAMLVGIDRAYDTYASHLKRVSMEDRIDSLPKVFLSPQTRIKSSKNKEFFMSDNATWQGFNVQNDDTNADQIFIIHSFPHSVDYSKGHARSFWENPAIFAHEYGHHILHHLSPDLTVKQDGSKMARWLGAIHEGFADMISSIALKNSNLLQELQIISDDGYSRVVPYPKIEHLHNDGIIYGVDKKVDGLFLHLALGAKVKFDTSDIQKYMEAKAQAVHGAGSVLAHIFHELMRVNKLEKNKPEMMDAATAWVEALNSKRIWRNSERQLPTTIEKSISAMVHEIWKKKSFGSKKKFKRRLKELIPAIDFCPEMKKKSSLLIPTRWPWLPLPEDPGFWN